MILDRIRRFQEALVESGVARSVLALPAPRTLLLENTSSTDGGRTTAFLALVTEPELVQVCRDLFGSGHFNTCVENAFKAVDNYVRDRTKSTDNGTALMERVFSPKNPRLYWTERKTRSEQNEQEGYQRIFAGAMLAIRNPTTHEFDWIDAPEDALELLVFAQHLLRMAKNASAA